MEGFLCEEGRNGVKTGYQLMSFQKEFVSSRSYVDGII